MCWRLEVELQMIGVFKHARYVRGLNGVVLPRVGGAEPLYQSEIYYTGRIFAIPADRVDGKVCRPIAAWAVAYFPGNTGRLCNLQDSIGNVNNPYR